MIYYYEVALLKSPLNNLTFQSTKKIEVGLKVLVNLKNQKKPLEAVAIKSVEKPDFNCSDILEVSTKIYSSLMLEVADFIAKYYVCSLGYALAIFQPFDKTIKIDNDNIDFKSDIELSTLQNRAKEFLLKNRQALLFAVTGSGKTEIYIKIIEDILNKDKSSQAIFLMPEISLTPQMQKRLEKVFKNSIAIWHSKISSKRKTEILNSLQNGKIRLVAGARSALFLPYSNLKLIVVDEEHDDSYKSDSKPRYNAKDLAIYIAKKYDINLILGSATPSLATFYKIPYFKLENTFYDTKKSYIFTNSSNTISSLSLEKIESCLNSNNQVIVFLPTRANFKHQICFDCGKSVECPFCSVSMSLHKNDLALKCHYCGYTEKIPNFCPSCKTGVIKNHRVGTAQIEEELKKHFPNRVIKRFDTDEIKNTKILNERLKEFNDNKIDILVGTQMLSKGHDYHNVKLAVVLGIDFVLNMNSYKAREKALSLLTQIAGRSGRNGFGEVIVETKNIDFFKYYLEESNYLEFLNSEMEFRKDLYPPFVKLARVTFSNKDVKKAKDELENGVKFLQTLDDIDIIGYGESNIFKIANKYRYEILFRSKSVKTVLQALHFMNSSSATIDMDTIY